MITQRNLLVSLFAFENSAVKWVCYWKGFIEWSTDHRLREMTNPVQFDTLICVRVHFTVQYQRVTVLVLVKISTWMPVSYTVLIVGIVLQKHWLIHTVCHGECYE